MPPRTDRDGEIVAWINLGLVPGLGPANYRALLSAFGLPERILGATHTALSAIVPKALATAILSHDRGAAISRTLDWLRHPGHHILTLIDAAYPKQLLDIPDPPPVLYVRGDPARLSAPSIAIVGSRNATPGGVNNAETFAKALSESGLTVVSGLALGIDTAAHRGGLASRGSTVAVMGTGIDIIYPRRNDIMAQQIAEQGALVSEFSLGTAPLPGNFPRRNRLIGGLSRGVLVVEAALASGSLITARLAAEQGREVFAIPGSIHSPLSKGCHALIKQGAKLVESADDVLEEAGYASLNIATTQHYVSTSESVLLQHMGYDVCNIETICMRSGLTAAAVSAMLLTLELDGKVGSLPGGLYQRLS